MAEVEEGGGGSAHSKYETEKVLWQEDAKSDFNLSPMTIEGVRRGGCRRGMFWRLGKGRGGRGKRKQGGGGGVWRKG